MFPLFWLTVAAFVGWQFGRAGGRGVGRRDARSVCAERYARNDTTPDGYRERLSALKGDQR